VAAASRVARGVLIGLGLAAYAVLAHLSNAHPDQAPWGPLLAVAPVALAAVLLALRARHRFVALGVCAVAAIVVARLWPELETHYALLYAIQDAGVYAVLAAVFARTLAPGHEPLCAQFAAIVHGPLPPEVARYTRRLTAAWVAFFVALAIADALLFAVLPLAVWSAFANFVTLPLVGVMFAIEYAVRRRALPHLEHRGLLLTLRTVFGSGWRPSLAASRN